MKKLFALLVVLVVAMLPVASAASVSPELVAKEYNGMTESVVTGVSGMLDIDMEQEEMDSFAEYISLARVTTDDDGIYCTNAAGDVELSFFSNVVVLAMNVEDDGVFSEMNIRRLPMISLSAVLMKYDTGCDAGDLLEWLLFVNNGDKFISNRFELLYIEMDGTAALVITVVDEEPEVEDEDEVILEDDGDGFGTDEDDELILEDDETDIDFDDVDFDSFVVEDDEMVIE